jgi:hypothetical protein
MLVKKSPATRTAAPVLPIRNSDRQLRDLYARRAAVESLIESLEIYRRFHGKRLDLRKRKTA